MYKCACIDCSSLVQRGEEYKSHNYDFSQNSYCGHLACTSIATLMACSMADNDTISRFDPEDGAKMAFLVEFGSGLWKENTNRASDESVQSIIDKHTFFKTGVNYDNESYQGVVGSYVAEGRINLNLLLKEIQKTCAKRGSTGAVMTDNVVSFAVGMVGIPTPRWVIFDSHSPSARYYTAPAADLAYVEHKVKTLMCKKNGLFDCTVFWRHEQPSTQ